MIRVRLIVVVVLAVVFITAVKGASFRTANFIVEAPTDELAREFGYYAEKYRKEKAVAWLGKEMPRWAEPCPLTVTINPDAPGGATSFAFPGPTSQRMEISGPRERLLNSVLPHEVTHTVFAHHFRQPVPRWADEGGSVLSEDDIERRRHDQMVRQLLGQGRAMRLSHLFSLTDYPRDVMVLYAQGYSVTSYLVGKSDRAKFLAFVGAGMRSGWPGAVKSHYGFESSESLEASWIDSLKGKPEAATSARLVLDEWNMRQLLLPRGTRLKP